MSPPKERRRPQAEAPSKSNARQNRRHVEDTPQGLDEAITARILDRAMRTNWCGCDLRLEPAPDFLPGWRTMRVVHADGCRQPVPRDVPFDEPSGSGVPF
jgi:hypothetical protein